MLPTAIYGREKRKHMKKYEKIFIVQRPLEWQDDVRSKRLFYWYHTKRNNVLNVHNILVLDLSAACSLPHSRNSRLKDSCNKCLLWLKFLCMGKCVVSVSSLCRLCVVSSPAFSHNLQQFILCSSTARTTSNDCRYGYQKCSWPDLCFILALVFSTCFLWLRSWTWWNALRNTWRPTPRWGMMGRTGREMTEISLLGVIPTMTFVHFLTGKSSGILSDIFAGILPGILSGISSGISSGILSGKSSGILSGISSGIYLTYLLAFYLAYLLAYILTHLLAFYLAFYLANLLAFYLTYLLAFYLAFYLAYLLACILTYLLAFYLAFYLAYLQAFYLAYLLTFYLTSFLTFFPLRSGSAHCDLEVAVEVRQCRWGPCPLGIWTARRRRRVRRRRRRQRGRRRRRRRRTALIKSNNPHLAGGEQRMCAETRSASGHSVTFHNNSTCALDGWNWKMFTPLAFRLRVQASCTPCPCILMNLIEFDRSSWMASGTSLARGCLSKDASFSYATTRPTRS